MEDTKNNEAKVNTRKIDDILDDILNDELGASGDLTGLSENLRSTAGVLEVQLLGLQEIARRGYGLESYLKAVFDYWDSEVYGRILHASNILDELQVFIKENHKS